MSSYGDVGSFIESKTLVVQTSNVGFTSEVSDYLVVHTGPGEEVYQLRCIGTWWFGVLLHYSVLFYSILDCGAGIARW